MSLNKKIFFSFLISSSLWAVTFYTQAAGLVPCGNGSDEANRCTLCHLFKGIQNIIKWGEGILIIVAIVAIVAGAIMYIISAGNSSAMESAKGIIKQALWGVVITLGAWLIVNTTIWLIGGNLNKNLGIANWYDFQCDATVMVASEDVGGGGVVDSGGKLPGSISEACDKYDADFDAASGGDPELSCLLKATAMAESTCNPNAQGGNGCGLMQIEGGDCEYLKSHPKESIQQAAAMMAKNKAIIASYATKYGYDIGTDDLIAAYNGGPGDNIAKGVKQTFFLSTDCTDKPTPAWQCTIKPGGFALTQSTYVPNVINYQQQCLGD